jgi:DNA-binding MarR family transcriptional regulator
MAHSIKNKIQRLSKAFPIVMHSFHNLAGEVSKTGEFTLAQYRILMLLHHRGAMTVNAVRQTLNTAQSTVSEMVDRLMAQELVARGENPQDRRQTILQLTGQGQRIITERMSSMEKVYGRILEDLSEDEQEQLISSFENISKILNRKQDEAH